MSKPAWQKTSFDGHGATGPSGRAMTIKIKEKTSGFCKKEGRQGGGGRPRGGRDAAHGHAGLRRHRLRRRRSPRRRQRRPERGHPLPPGRQQLHGFAGPGMGTGIHRLRAPGDAQLRLQDPHRRQLRHRVPDQELLHRGDQPGRRRQVRRRRHPGARHRRRRDHRGQFGRTGPMGHQPDRLPQPFRRQLERPGRQERRPQGLRLHLGPESARQVHGPDHHDRQPVSDRRAGRVRRGQQPAASTRL